METMNGYVIIAARPHARWADARVILGATEHEHGFEYVVATAALRETAPTSWNHGDYTMNLDDAVQAYRER